MKLILENWRKYLNEGSQWGGFTGGAAPLDEPRQDSGPLPPDQLRKLWGIYIEMGMSPEEILQTPEFIEAGLGSPEQLREADDFDWDAFGFSDEEIGKPEASPDPHYEDLIGLDRGDTFTIGNRKPVYRVIGAPTANGKAKGSPIKTAVIHGSAERKYYIIKGVSEDYAVGAFEAVGGGSDTVENPRGGKTGFVMNITKALRDT